MKIRNIFFMVLASLVMGLSGRVPIYAAENAETIMCDGGVVNIGDKDVDVQKNCGQPNSQTMNQWVYNFGPSQPVYTVIFKEGKILQILEERQDD